MFKEIIKPLVLILGLCPLCSYALSFYVNANYPNMLLVEDTFEIGDVDLMLLHLSDNKIDTILFNSEGGNMVESLAIGSLIRDYKLNTIVPINAYCYSACTYAFMGGVERTIDVSAEFAMHRPFFNEEMPGMYNEGYNSGIITSVLISSYLIEMGLEPNIAIFHLLSKKLKYFNTSEQKELNIITARK
jgi:hypothetical protein